MVQMNLCMKQKLSHRCRKQTYGYQGGSRGGINWEIGIDIYTLLLGWPKIHSGFSVTAYGKKPNELFGQTNIYKTDN